MASCVTVLDYGVGNLLSVQRALEHCGAAVTVTTDPASVARADRLVLPGVGAFGNGIRGLRAAGLDVAIQSFAQTQRPFLGICLGMQLMLEESSEFGRHLGLGIIPGRVEPVPPAGTDGAPHKIPHVGWSGLEPVDGWAGTLLDGIAPGACAYFVHSFAAFPAQKADCLARTLYDGIPITAVLRVGPLMGCQFHPEKSGLLGLRILRNFLGS